MALMLRQACEPILSDYDLDAYHVDLDKDFHMCLFTPCGKQFAVVHGVNFSRKHPTQAEVDYATNLLTDWCERNKNEFNNYIQARELLDRMGEEPEDTFQYGGYSIDVLTASDKDWVPSVGWVHRPRGMSFSRKNTLWTYNLPKDGKQPTLRSLKGITRDNDPKDAPAPSITGREKVPAKVLAQAIARFEEIMAYRQAKKAVENIQSELNTCYG